MNYAATQRLPDDLAADQGPDLRVLLDGVWRRRTLVIGVGTVIFLACAALALLLPPVYRSTATILIEDQEIPQDLVRTTISSYADLRIQIISQQVMTRANLMQIVDKYRLFEKERQTQSTEEILASMRQNIKLDLVTSNAQDRGGRRATIAFNLSFDDANPANAQRVANELVSLYLSRNLEIRQQKAAETSSFLAEEGERLAKHIDQLEGKIAAFKARNQGRLPEVAAFNVSTRDRLEAEIWAADSQLRTIDERRQMIESQLALIKPEAPLKGLSGEAILTPEERLKALQTQFASLEGVYSADHPDMARMRRQIQALERESGAEPDAAGERADRLEQLRVRRDLLRERYAAEHPDVVKIERSIAALERAAEAPPPAARAPSGRKPENPAWVTLSTQLDTLNVEAKAVQVRRADLQARLGMIDGRIEQAPLVEKEYLDLTRDRDTSVARYREMRGKLMEAEVAQELERDRKSERFSLIDPPELPQRARSPNRPLILVMGFIAALGGGLGGGLALAAMDGSVRSSRELARTLPVPLLSVIPYIENGRERDRRSRRRIVLAVAGAVGALLAALLVHFFFMPLDVLWYVLLRRLNLD
jgi:uncharacterized protein involved in exopolysaccharide biosynthesis